MGISLHVRPRSGGISWAQFCHYPKLSDRCFNAAAKVVGALVTMWKPEVKEIVKDERKAELVVRGCIGAAMLTVAVSQLKKSGLDKATVQEQLDDAWKTWTDEAN